MADIILAILVLAPAVFVFVLRSNGALSFLTLCASFVLITFASADLKDLTKNLNLQITASTLNLILLIAPFLLTLLLTRKSFSGSIKLTFHLVVSLCAGGLFTLITVPLLSSSTRADFANSSGWAALQKAQTAIIVTGVLLSFVLIWLGKSRRHYKHHNK